MNHYLIFVLPIFVNIALCSDFYVGMFKKNDILVAQDRVYKPKMPYRMTYAKYGRYFKCPITYFRVVDRLGMGRGPRVEIIRGGLGKRYMVLRLTSSYNLPISVNVYVGCENKITTTTKQTTTHTTTTHITTTTHTDGGGDGNSTEVKTTISTTDGRDGNSTDVITTDSNPGDEVKTTDTTPGDEAKTTDSSDGDEVKTTVYTTDTNE